MVLQIVSASTILRTTIAASMCCSTSLSFLYSLSTTSNRCDRTVHMQIANEDYSTELVLTISFVTRNTTNMHLR